MGFCEDVPVEQMAKSYMQSPSWRSRESDNGLHIVDVTGKITYDQKEVKAAIQFLVAKENKSFSYRAFEMNGLRQDDATVMTLFDEMCESALETYRIYDRAASTEMRNARTYVEAYAADHGMYPDTIEASDYKPSDGVRCQYRKKSADEYDLMIYHVRGLQKFSANSQSGNITEERR